MANVLAITTAGDKWLFMHWLRFLPRIFAFPTVPPSQPPGATLFSFPSDLIRKQCMMHFLTCARGLVLQHRLHIGTDVAHAVLGSVFSVTELWGGASPCAPAEHSHMPTISSPQPFQWLLPCFNGPRQHTDTCNTSGLITQRPSLPPAPPTSTPLHPQLLWWKQQSKHRRILSRLLSRFWHGGEWSTDLPLHQTYNRNCCFFVHCWCKGWIFKIQKIFLKSQCSDDVLQCI